MAVVAARQGRSSAFRRRTLVRRRWCRLAVTGAPVSTLLCGLVLAAALDVATTMPASAQSFTYNPRPPKPPPARAANDGQMLVQAVEVDYDYNNQRVSAVGNVQMFYNGTGVEADKVIYDQKTKRLHAEGNVRMTDAEGKITYANVMDLSDDYRDGFVEFAARRHRRRDANGGDARRPLQRQLHRFRERRLYRLRALQGRSQEAAAVAGQGRAYHPRSNRKDAVFRERAAGVLRRSDGVSAVLLDARSDRKAQDRVPDAELQLGVELRVRHRDPVVLSHAPTRCDLEPRFTTEQGAPAGRLPPSA